MRKSPGVLSQWWAVLGSNQWPLHPRCPSIVPVRIGAMKTPEQIGAAVLERLAAQAAANRAAGDRLRADVRTVLEQNPGHPTAKQVIKKLGRQLVPSVRRVQEILKELRAESSVSRSGSQLLRQARPREAHSPADLFDSHHSGAHAGDSRGSDARLSVERVRPEGLERRYRYPSIVDQCGGDTGAVVRTKQKIR